MFHFGLEIGKLGSEKVRHLPKVTQLFNSSSVVSLTPVFFPPQKAAYSTQFICDHPRQNTIKIKDA